MALDASAMTAHCRFCGTQYVLDHKDTDYFLDFYRQVNDLISAEDDSKRKELADRLWDTADEKVFTTSDGRVVTVYYLYSFSEPECDVYIARRNIIFHFKKNGAQLSDRYRINSSMLDYPSADTKNLSDFFPKVTSGFNLDDGTDILVVAKDEDEYPLRLFGKLHGRHVAWIISRLENLCCVLEYNGLVHPQLDPDTVFINPYIHQASLYGNWWNVTKNNTLSSDRMHVNTTAMNLYGLRNTAAFSLGFNDVSEVTVREDIPAPFADFLKSAPEVNAYSDFEKWDETLIKSFGERRFYKFTGGEDDIYKKGQE